MNTNHPDFVGFDKLVSLLFSLYISIVFIVLLKELVVRKKPEHLATRLYVKDG